METSVGFMVLLGLTSGFWTGAHAQGPDPSVVADVEDDCCERCPPGWTQSGDNCYIFYFDQKEWADAEVACIAIGGNLASVHSKEQLTFIEELVKRSTGSAVQTWVGGQDATKDTVWMWSDGAKFDYKFWGQSEPSNKEGENCLGISPDGTANDTKCQNKNSFVCGKRL